MTFRLRLAPILLAATAGFASGPTIRGQTYEDIHDFEHGPPSHSPRSPDGHLKLGPDGNFYGVSVGGGRLHGLPDRLRDGLSPGG